MILVNNGKFSSFQRNCGCYNNQFYVSLTIPRAIVVYKLLNFAYFLFFDNLDQIEKFSCFQNEGNKQQPSYA